LRIRAEELPVDHAQLLKLTAPEVFASVDAKEKFITDFVAVWIKVMNLD
jgi:catalase-peroxidase